MAISIIGSRNVLSAGGGVQTLTTASIDSTGSSLVIINVADGQGSTLGVISDNKGNTWTALTTYNDGVLTRCKMYYCINPTVGSGHTFTYTSTTNSFASVTVLLLANTGAIDQTNGASSAVLVSSLAPGSVTPGVNDEIVITGVNGGGGTNPAPGTPTGYTLVLSNSAVLNARFASGMAYQIQTTATATNPSWTFGTITRASTNIVTFRFLPVTTGGGNFFLFM